MENSIFWKSFEETGKVADYLRYRYEGEDASYLDAQKEEIYHTEALKSGEEQKWEIQLQ